MNEIIKNILNECGIIFENENELNGMLIPRESLLDITKYDNIKSKITELKKLLSSSYLTSLQKNAEKQQKWPLLNLVRQILTKHKYNMNPIRKSDGYILDGIKKFKRFFQIQLREN
jgi:hypothetical protein